MKKEIRQAGSARVGEFWSTWELQRRGRAKNNKWAAENDFFLGSMNKLGGMFTETRCGSTPARLLIIGQLTELTEAPWVSID